MYNPAYWTLENLETETKKILLFVDEKDFKLILKLRTGPESINYCNKIQFLHICMCLSVKYPQIYNYLEDFLKTFSSFPDFLLDSIVFNMYNISFDVFELLIDKMKELDSIDKTNNKSLYLLVHLKNRFEFILKDYEDNYDLCISKSDTLTHAIKFIKLLLDYGIDVNNSNRHYNNWTVLDNFKYRMLTEFDKSIIKVLIDYGAIYNQSIHNDEFINFVEGYRLKNVKAARININK